MALAGLVPHMLRWHEEKHKLKVRTGTARHTTRYHGGKGAP
jgi:hypothetical protein